MNRVSMLSAQLDKGEAALILSPQNRFYYTGVMSSDGILLVCGDSAQLLVDFRYYEYAKKKSAVAVTLITGSCRAQIINLINSAQFDRLYVERDFITANLYAAICENNGLEIADLAAKPQMRAVKDKNELDLIKKAQGITDKTYADILCHLSAGLTERDVKARLIYYLYKNGASALAFEPIVLSGGNCSLPHGHTTDRVIRAGDFVLLDFGAVYGGYCSDMTRTVAIDYATDQMQEVYELVLKAHIAAAGLVKAGLTGKEVDGAARDIIYKGGYEGCFEHSTGHGVGIDVHEMPNLSPANDKPLPLGCVVTVEPGIYIEGRLGCRLENMMYVKREKSECLTKSDMSLKIIKSKKEN